MLNTLGETFFRIETIGNMAEVTEPNATAAHRTCPSEKQEYSLGIYKYLKRVGSVCVEQQIHLRRRPLCWMKDQNQVN